MSFFFFFYKNGEQEGKTGSGWGIGTSGSGEGIKKGCKRVNMMEMLCTHVCKWINGTC
jgi:hypothetical protein